MMGLLASLGGNALRTLLPAAMNWGMNKLSTSNFGRSFVVPALTAAMAPKQEAVVEVEQSIPNQEGWEDEKTVTFAADRPRQRPRKRKGILKRRH